MYSGVQKSDGLLPTCKSTLLDFDFNNGIFSIFCGLMELLIISEPSEN
jgi:hypothetical protein